MNHDFTFVRPLGVASSIFHTPPLPFYLDEAILDKEIMALPRVTKEKKRSGITYSMPPISQRSPLAQTPGAGPSSTKRDWTP
jgi:hypothetical protein